MNSRTLTELVKFFSNSSIIDYEVERTGGGNSTSPTDSKTNIYGNMQIFSDHLKTTKRFQKTLYYGDFLQSNFHSPLALTDVTLEFFNKTVPNAGRLDILDMDYATSISKSVCVSPYSMVLAMMYLEQLRHKNPGYLENVSPCDLFVVSILVASKYLFDNDEEFIYNCDWADAANVDVQDLNHHEKDFLHAINWELYTNASDFYEYLLQIEKKIALKQTSQRGWFSYTDIVVLADGECFMEFWWTFSGFIIKTVVVVIASYATVVSALCGLSITCSTQAHIPARNFIEIVLHHEFGSSLQFVSTPLPVENASDLDYEKTDKSHYCQLPYLNYVDFCATKNDIKNAEFPRTCHISDENISLHTGDGTKVANSLLPHFSKSNAIHNNEMDDSLLLFLLLYTECAHMDFVVKPPYCDSIVINFKCNYSLSQA